MKTHKDIAETIAAGAIENARNGQGQRAGRVTRTRLEDGTKYGIVAVVFAVGVLGPLGSLANQWRLEHACPAFCSAKEVEAAKIADELKQLQSALEQLRRN